MTFRHNLHTIAFFVPPPFGCSQARKPSNEAGILLGIPYSDGIAEGCQERFQLHSSHGAVLGIWRSSLTFARKKRIGEGMPPGYKEGEVLHVEEQ